MNRENRIKEKLATLNPSYFSLINESVAHAKHYNDDTKLTNQLQGESKNEYPETHFSLQISSDIFTGKSLIACHKIINQILKDEFEQGLHALSIKIK